MRSASLRDLQAVTSVNWQSLPEHYSDFFLQELLQNSPETFLISEKLGKIVGYIMCRTEYGFSTTRKFGLARKGHIVSVAVLDADRRKGVGRAMVEEALKGMKQRGCTEAYLEVRVSNEPAITLYRNMGFVVTARLESYYRDGEAAFQMSLPLAQG